MFFIFLIFIKTETIIANETYLAYIKIDDADINKISANGLKTISNLLQTEPL